MATKRDATRKNHIPDETAARFHALLDRIDELAEQLKREARAANVGETMMLRRDMSGIKHTTDAARIELRRLNGGYRVTERTMRALAGIAPAGFPQQPSALERFLTGADAPQESDGGKRHDRSERVTRLEVLGEVKAALEREDGIGSVDEALAVVRRLRSQTPKQARDANRRLDADTLISIIVRVTDWDSLTALAEQYHLSVIHRRAVRGFTAEQRGRISEAFWNRVELFEARVSKRLLARPSDLPKSAKTRAGATPPPRAPVSRTSPRSTPASPSRGKGRAGR